jgi:hypothetical protein
MAFAGEAAARRAAEKLLAAAAAEPPRPEGAGGGAAPPSAPTAPRPRVLATLEALQSALRGAGPAAAAAALGVDGLVPALLREAAGPADPGGSLDSVTCAFACLLRLTQVANRNRRAGPAAAISAALSAALRRDTAVLLDGVARAAAAQAAARDAGPTGSAGAGPVAAASLATVAPGEQLSLMLHLAGTHLLGGSGVGAGAPAQEFARSGAAVAATLEALLHGCPGQFGDMRFQAASVLERLCSDVQAVPHLRGSFPQIVPALIQRLEPGVPLAEQLCVLRALQVRRGPHLP